MNICCDELEKAIEHEEITRAFYPSGIECYMTIDFDPRPSKTPKGKRICYCPFCGKFFV